MIKIPRVSDAEWRVMEVLWGAGGSPRTAAEVIGALAAHAPGWSPRTIKTMINRLVKKGALRFTAEGKRYLYQPAVSREEVVKVESRSFIDRLFGGSVGPMLAHFVEDGDLSAEEIERLRRILDEKKGR